TSPRTVRVSCAPRDSSSTSGVISSRASSPMKKYAATELVTWITVLIVTESPSDVRGRRRIPAIAPSSISETDSGRNGTLSAPGASAPASSSRPSGPGISAPAVSGSGECCDLRVSVIFVLLRRGPSGAPPVPGPGPVTTAGQVILSRARCRECRLRPEACRSGVFQARTCAEARREPRRYRPLLRRFRDSPLQSPAAPRSTGRATDDANAGNLARQGITLPGEVGPGHRAPGRIPSGVPRGPACAGLATAVEGAHSTEP